MSYAVAFKFISAKCLRLLTLDLEGITEKQEYASDEIERWDTSEIYER